MKISALVKTFLVCPLDAISMGWSHGKMKGTHAVLALLIAMDTMYGPK